MTVDNFPAFAKAVAVSFQELVAGSSAFVAAIDSLYEEYLAAFPEGSNQVFKTRVAPVSGTRRSCERHAISAMILAPTPGSTNALRGRTRCWTSAASL